MARREGAEDRFGRLYGEHGRALLAYALRRTSDAQDAADLVADVFLVAWRRLDDVPPGEGGRLWLYGVARHALANQQRSERRRVRLAERLYRELPAAVQSMPVPAPAPEAGGASGGAWASRAGGSGDPAPDWLGGAHAG